MHPPFFHFFCIFFTFCGKLPKGTHVRFMKHMNGPSPTIPKISLQYVIEGYASLIS